MLSRVRARALCQGLRAQAEITFFMSGDIQEKVRRDHRPALASGLMLDPASSSTSSALRGCTNQTAHICMGDWTN